MTTETTWKPVRGYEGLYAVNQIGQVIRTKPYNNSTGKPLASPLAHGYPRVGLSKNGFVSYHLVHRLVADAFIGIKDGQIVNHIDGNPGNPRLENLEVCDYSRNEWHKRHVLMKNSRPSFTKLTPQIVESIRNELAAGAKGKSLAAKYAVSRSLISQVKRRQVWRFDY